MTKGNELAEGIDARESEETQGTETLFIGGGTMGRKMADALMSNIGTDRTEILERNSERYSEQISGAKIIVLATKQEDGLDWLMEYGNTLKQDQIVVSLVGFISFDLLDLAVGEHSFGICRMMTDTGLSDVVWSDDGSLGSEQKAKVQSLLESIGSMARHVGERNDQAIENETLLACLLGWLAQDLAMHTIVLERLGYDQTSSERIIDQRLRAISVQREEGLSYDEIFRNVATPEGVTMAGAEEVTTTLAKLLGRRMKVGIMRQEEIQEHFGQYVVKRKGLSGGNQD